MVQDLLENKFELEWIQIRPFLRDKWHNLTHEDVEQVNGHYEILVSKLQQRYGFSRDEAEEQIHELVRDKNARVSSERDKPYIRSLREEEAYARSFENSSLFKWLLPLAIAILLIAGYFALGPSQEFTPTATTPVAAIATPTDGQISNSVKNVFQTTGIMAADTANVNVDTLNGVVTLSGTVPSTQARDSILAATRNVNGVKDVIDHLQVR